MAGHDVVQMVCCQYRYELAASRAKARGMGRKPHKKGAPWRSFLGVIPDAAYRRKLPTSLY